MTINDKILTLVTKAEEECRTQYKRIDDIALHNQRKVLKAFQINCVADRHLKGTSGYGYDDIGRDMLSKVYSDVFCTDNAIVSPNISSGTQALNIALFGLLRPNDLLLSISGKPYDTLLKVISGSGIGSLKDFNINYSQIELKNDDFDYDKIKEAITCNSPKVVFITRSRGYSWRNALSIESIAKVINFIRDNNEKIIIMVDNCYGEFVEYLEPTDVGADVVVGSLIKNIGGGLAPSGGYIAGREECIRNISYRLTAPSIGSEVGSYYSGYQYFFQGLFIAPHVVANALKGSVLFGKVFSMLGYKTFPAYNSICYDIIRSIEFNTKEELIIFCQKIQEISPIDSNALPTPWDMPGYQDQVIMAAGTFVQGASIELSADSPIKAPYIAYLQGGLTYEHAKLAVIHCAEALCKLI
ncbi:MAG: hypothetical protein EOM87_03715 [Clostridia bacterium]|nr:hypothetical protein [Clostridia bacterium]